jgi:hypothetical protein
LALLRRRERDRKTILRPLVWARFDEYCCVNAASAETAELVAAFEAIVASPVDAGGLDFIPASMGAEEIRETHTYASVRIRFAGGIDVLAFHDGFYLSCM